MGFSRWEDRIEVQSWLWTNGISAGATVMHEKLSRELPDSAAVLRAKGSNLACISSASMVGHPLATNLR